MASDVSTESLVALTDGFSGAEVVNLCQEAALAAIEEGNKSFCFVLVFFGRGRDCVVRR